MSFPLSWFVCRHASPIDRTDWANRRLSCLSWKWRMRSSVRIIGRTRSNPGCKNLSRLVESETVRTAIESGTFRILHPTTESATIYRLADGNRLLRFTNFRTSNGPNVHVYLVPAPYAPDDATVERAGFIDLGKIKGNIGNQNYMLGGDVDCRNTRPTRRSTRIIRKQSRSRACQSIL